MALQYDYYYGKDSETFAFFRIPRIFMTDEPYKAMSIAAKLLYGLMLDRMRLSRENNWFDDIGRVYIKYSVSNIMKDLGCGKSKVLDTMSELEFDVGLIERVHEQQGKANRIYVKNFLKASQFDSGREPNFEETTHRVINDTGPKSEPVYFSDRYQERISTKGAEIKPVPCMNQDDNQTGLNIAPKVVSKSNPNNRTLNKNYDNHITQSTSSDRAVNMTEVISHKSMDTSDGNNPNAYKIASLSPFLDSKGTVNVTTVPEESDSYLKILNELRTQVDYEYMKGSDEFDMSIVDELIELMAEVMAYWKDDVTIGDQKIPVDMVKRRFKQIDYATIQYIIRCLRNTDTKVNNIRSYNLSVLYNAPVTMNSYYAAEVRHDMSNYVQNAAI